MPSFTAMITLFCTCDLYFYTPRQYLDNTQCSVHSPEVLREEILTAWHCLCATCPSFLLLQCRKYRGCPLPSAAQTPSYSLPQMVQTHLHCSQIDTPIFSDRISWHKLEDTLSLSWHYGLLFVIST